MNSYVCFVMVAMFAQAYSQCIPPCASTLAPVYAPGCGCGPVVAPPVIPGPVVATPVIQPNSVAATLADTLSLLTVSSLLAEKLPYGCPLAAPPCYPGYGYIL